MNPASMLNNQVINYYYEKYYMNYMEESQIITETYLFTDLQHQSTGQYREKSYLIWDPYPQYVINAFGLNLHLLLNQDASFLPKNLKVIKGFSL